MSTRLYRDFYDIMHPSISKKNISNYEIVIDSELPAIDVYYPAKLAEKKEMIIYIPDRVDNNDVYKDLAIETNNIVISVASKEMDSVYKLIKYVYDNAESIELDADKITLMSDYDGCDMLLNIKEKLKEDNYEVNKSILIDPKHDIDFNVYNKKEVLVITGVDSLIEDEENYNMINSYLGGFVTFDNLAARESVYSLILEFLN